MNEHHPDDELRDGLAAWDPAKRFGEAPPGILTRVRAFRQDERPLLIQGFLSPARLGWAMAFLILLVAVLTWQRMPVGFGTGAPAVEAQTTVRVQMHASNGTRIFWTIQSTSPPDVGERRNQ